MVTLNRITTGMRDTAKKIDENFQKIAGSDVEVTYITNFSSNFTTYGSSQDPLYYKKNGVVYLEGACTPTKTLTADLTTNYLMFTLPVGCRPNARKALLCQGSGDRLWLLQVDTDGSVSAGRYRNGAGAVSMATTNWLPFTISFKAED